MKREVVTWSCAARTRVVFQEERRFDDALILYARSYLGPVAILDACEFKVPSPGQISEQLCHGALAQTVDERPHMM